MGYVTKEEVACESCGRIIHRNELQYDSVEGRICLDCYERKQPRQTTPLKETPRKNPWIAAILNFLIPGIGFIYLGTTPFIVGGAVLFIFGMLETVITWSMILDPLTMTLSFLLAFLWAVLGYVAAEYVNKSTRPPTPVELPEPLRAKPHRRPAVDEVSRPEKVALKTERAIYCINCGEKLPSHAAYCRKCGKKVE